MRGRRDIIRANARAAGQGLVACTVYVVVDLDAVTSSRAAGDNRSVAQVVADEIRSNLESVNYVDQVLVRRTIA